MADSPSLPLQRSGRWHRRLTASALKSRNRHHVRLQHLIGEPGGETVVVTGGKRSELPLQDGSVLVVDAERAHSNNDDCHYYDMSLAVRRVNL